MNFTLRKRKNIRKRRLSLQPLETRRVLAASLGWDGPGQGQAELTYYIANSPNSLTQAQTNAAIETALAAWASAADITFTPTSQPGLPDSIDFSFVNLDGAGRTLAQAYFPDDVNPSRIAGDVQFDSSEIWEVGNALGSRAFDLVWVAVHEIGHSLGLDHTTDNDSVLEASVSPNQSFSSLSSVDIAGIQGLYAPADGTSTTTTTIETPVDATPADPTDPGDNDDNPFPRQRWHRGGHWYRFGGRLDTTTPDHFNLYNPTDVNGDNSISASDALMIINQINRAFLDSAAEVLGMCDTNGDGTVSASDALNVINVMNLASFSGADASGSDLGGAANPTIVVETTILTGVPYPTDPSSPAPVDDTLPPVDKTPTTPVDDPTTPVDDPTTPVDDTTKPVDDPAKPVDEPAKPVDDPAKPVDEPTKPVDEPTKPVDEPTKPVDDTTKPVDDPTKPVDEPTTPVDDTTKPVDDTTKPVDEPTTPVDDTTKPVDDTTKPVDDSTDPIDDGGLTDDDVDCHSEKGPRVGSQDKRVGGIFNVGLVAKDPGELIARLDTSDDGSLSEDEVPAKLWESFTTQNIDADGDGLVTLAELETAITAARTAKFAEQDTNADGLLQADEVGARVWGKLSAADTDSNNGVSLAELDAWLASQDTTSGDTQHRRDAHDHHRVDAVFAKLGQVVLNQLAPLVASKLAGLGRH